MAIQRKKEQCDRDTVLVISQVLTYPLGFSVIKSIQVRLSSLITNKTQPEAIHDNMSKRQSDQTLYGKTHTPKGHSKLFKLDHNNPIKPFSAVSLAVTSQNDDPKSFCLQPL